VIFSKKHWTAIIECSTYGPGWCKLALLKDHHTYIVSRFVDLIFQEEKRICSTKDLKDLKDFIRHLALGMDGVDGYDTDDDDDTDDECDCLPSCEKCRRKKWVPPCVESVRNYWNNFTGAWKRAYPDDPIPLKVRESATQVHQHSPTR